MATFDEKMEVLCNEGKLAGVVLVAGDRTGDFKYSKAFGLRTLKDLTKPEPMPLDATMWIASCTKMMTTVAAMQCVERGLLSLDADVSEILPELKGLEILTGFDDAANKPILIPNKKPITLRHLLTHSSGFAYDDGKGLLHKWAKATGNVPDQATVGQTSVTVFYKYPLLYAPEDAWSYGPGVDFAGLMVERVNGNVKLEDYMREHVWDPLGIKDITFSPTTNSAVFGKLADMSYRTGAIDPTYGANLERYAPIEYTDNRIWPRDATICHGGAGLFTSAVEYQKLLQSLISNDGKVLKPETLDDMFKPQLSKAASASLNESNKTLGLRGSGAPLNTKVDFGLGGLLNLEDFEGRKAGSIAWGGYPGLLWWADRKGGLCGILGSQLIPPGDLLTDEVFFEWEIEMYKKVRA